MDNAQMIFDRIVTEKYQGICQYISEKQEEHLFLDFKEKSDALNNGLSTDDKKNYAIALSGFSNSSGGVIVWGVKAKKDGEQLPDVACAEKPIKHLKRFLTDLNSLISDAMVPVNQGIKNIPIYLNDNEASDEGFIITYVPEGIGLPHCAMCRETRYYHRAGDSFLKMEHHQLADMFGRRQKPDLNIMYRMNKTKVGNKYKVDIIVGMENLGRYLATYPALRIKPIVRLKHSDFGVSGNREWVLHPQTQSYETIANNGKLFVGGINDAIYPETFLEVALLEVVNQFDEDMFLFPVKPDPSVLKFEYEIFCEGCQTKKGEVDISIDEIKRLLD